MNVLLSTVNRLLVRLQEENIIDVIHKTWIDIRTEIEEQCKVLIEGTGDQFVSAYKEIL